MQVSIPAPFGQMRSLIRFQSQESGESSALVLLPSLTAVYGAVLRNAFPGLIAV